MLNRKNITGIILIGGQSRRMGRDKGHMIHQGKTFVEHILTALNPLADKVLLVGDNRSYDTYGIKRVEDKFKDQGPIAGICAGLDASETEYNIILSCDVPLINTSVLRLLIEAHDHEFDLIQMSQGEFTYPLIGLYNKNCLAQLTEVLISGEKRLTEAIKRLKVKTIMVDDEIKQLLVNINTKEDLKTIEHGLEH